MCASATIEVVEEFPLPFSRGEILAQQYDAMQGDQPFVQSLAEVERTVDGFHERYLEELVRTNEWVVFRCYWRGHQNWVYFWSHAGGFGFRVRDCWEVMCPLVAVLEAFTDEYDASDFEPAYYPWELP